MHTDRTIQTTPEMYRTLRDGIRHRSNIEVDGFALDAAIAKIMGLTAGSEHTCLNVSVNCARGGKTHGLTLVEVAVEMLAKVPDLCVWEKGEALKGKIVIIRKGKKVTVSLTAEDPFWLEWENFFSSVPAGWDARKWFDLRMPEVVEPLVGGDEALLAESLDALWRRCQRYKAGEPFFVVTRERQIGEPYFSADRSRNI